MMKLIKSTILAFGPSFLDFISMKECRPAVLIISAVYYTACGMVFIAGKNILSFRYVVDTHFTKPSHFGSPTYIKLHTKM
jgi:hypothetical protein